MMNLKTRVLFVVAVLFVLSMWALALRASSIMEDDIEVVLGEQMGATVKFLASDIDTQIELRMALLREVAATITPEIMADRGQLRRLLGQRSLSRKIFPLGPFVVDAQGNIIADYPTLEGRVGNSIADFEYFRALMASGKPTVANPLMGRFSKRVAVPLAVPLYDAAGGVTGALVGAIFPTDASLFGRLDTAKPGVTGSLMVVSAKSRVIISATDKTRIMQPMSPKGANHLLEKWIDKGYVNHGLTTVDGIEVISAAAAAKSAPWIVLAQVPVEEAFAPLAKLKRQIYLAALMITLVIVAGLGFVLRRLLSPLDQAAAQIRRMTSGEAPLSTLPVVRDDEIGALIKDFNQLVAERKRAEASLTLTAAVVEASRDAIVSRTVDGIVLSWNRGAEILFGYDKAEMVGRHISVIVPVELRTELRLGEEIDVNFSARTHDSRRLRKDGRLIDVSISAGPIRDSAGAVSGVALIFRDISERLQAEAAHMRLAAIIEHSNDAILSRALDGTILSWNAGAEKMFGYTAEEVMGKPIAITLPDRRANLVENNARVLRGEVVLRESERLTKDGRRIFVSSCHSPIRDGAGNITSISIILRDTTLLKDAQAAAIRMSQRLEIALEGSGTSIWEADLRTSEVWLDSAWAEFLGHESKAETHTTLTALLTQVHPDDRAIVTQALRKALKGETPAYLADHRVRSVSGQWLWTQCRGRIIERDGDGRALRMSGTNSDITARKRAEAEHSLLAAVVENSNDAIFIRSLDGTILTWNTGAERMLGYTAAEAIGKPSNFAVPPGQVSKQPSNTEKLLAGEMVVAHESRRVSKSGRVFTVSTSLSPVKDAAGRITGISVILQDISALKQAEAERARLASIVESSNDAIMTRSFDGTILTWNAGAAKLLGYTAAEAIGRSSDFLIPANRRPNRVQNTEALLRGETVSRETNRLTKDGRIIDVFSSQSPIKDDTGKVVGASIILQDISQRKQFEEALAKLAAVTESSNDAIYMSDVEGKIVYWNHSARRLYGYSSDEVMGRDNSFLIPPEVMNELTSNQAKIRSGKSVLEYETTRLCKDGSCVHVTVGVSLVKDGNGTVIGTATVARDITARRQAEAERVALESQLRESQKMEAIGTLAGGIAHDFNNALATILGNVELARQDSTHNPPALESLEEIRKAGTRARNLVQQILSFSRRQPIERKPIDLAPVVTEAARLLRATLPARLSLEVSCDPVPPVLADAGQIAQILINLGTNALQAVRNGPGRIDMRLDTVPLDAITSPDWALEALRARQPGRAVRIIVSDSGQGMDAVTKERLFEPFFTTKPVGEGTGLGLSVVHGIVQGHEGVITVDSEPGKGATFIVYLPVAKAEAYAKADAEAETEAEASTQPLKPGGTRSSVSVSGPGDDPCILYLDDDDSMVFLVERLLKRSGYRVAAFTRHEEALRALRADPAGFDLVVTDYNMPGKSGLEVASEVRALNPNLAVAMTSGFIDDELRAQADGIGVRELIFKADEVEVFCEAVQRLAQAVRQ